LKEIDIPQQAIIKGDAKSASIAAAFILATVERATNMPSRSRAHIVSMMRRSPGWSNFKSRSGGFYGG
jgi:ribonuclease HII